jgi:hypothetical protein
MAILSSKTVAEGLRAAIRLKRGHLPTDAEMAAAPRLCAWVIQPFENGLVSKMLGIVENHPSVPDGVCVTSALLAIDPDRRWARTVSRLYRLGPSLESMTDDEEQAG